MKLEPRAIEHALQVGLRSGQEAPRRIGTKLLIKESTLSTNDDVAQLAIGGEGEGVVVFAENQSAGRGRKGNVWVAPTGENLMFSLLLRPEIPMALWPRLAHAVGVAIIWGLDPWVENAELQLKWPNDVYANGRKLAGILVESRKLEAGSFAVVGIGINVNTVSEKFPAELRQLVTSVRDLSGSALALDRNALAGSVLSELNRAYELTLTDFDAIRGEMERRSLLLGKRISCLRDGHTEEGMVVGFGPNGELRIRHEPSGTEEFVLSADHVRLA